ncbi:MAG: VCBS repeat-containing protein, partial [Eudoraea sp.]|nr:VCBS repeat-containing protein [Eudoraea sp.]
MKTKLFFLVLTCIFYVSSYGQHMVPGHHIITDNADGAASVFAADFNGDTFMDVVAASRFDNTIAWWENNGSGSFSYREITTNAIGVWSVHA